MVIKKRDFILLVSMAVLFFIVQLNLLLKLPTTNEFKLKLKHSIAGTSIVKQKKNKKKNSCVSLSSDDEKEASEISLESLLRNDDGILQQVFITMPAKAAGTSMKDFTVKCMKHNDNRNNLQSLMQYSNLLSKPQATKEKFFYEEFSDKNTIIASHMMSEEAFHELIQNMPYSTKNKRSSKGSLLIYIHRDETDRLVSAVRYILSKRVCVKKSQRLPWLTKFNANKQLNETTCIVNEEDVVKIIKEQRAEIGVNGNLLLTCNTYKILKENNPLSYFDDDDNDNTGVSSVSGGGVLFLDYSQVDKLHKILEKHHCPGMFSLMESNGSGAIHSNTAESGDVLKIFLRRRDNKKGNLVNLNDWLDRKRSSFEWALNLKGSVSSAWSSAWSSEASCQSTTKRIEENLYQCPDETMILPNSLLSSDAVSSAVSSHSNNKSEKKSSWPKPVKQRQTTKGQLDMNKYNKKKQTTTGQLDMNKYNKKKQPTSSAVTSHSNNKYEKKTVQYNKKKQPTSSAVSSHSNNKYEKKTVQLNMNKSNKKKQPTYSAVLNKNNKKKQPTSSAVTSHSNNKYEKKTVQYNKKKQPTSSAVSSHSNNKYEKKSSPSEPVITNKQKQTTTGQLNMNKNNKKKQPI